MAIPPLRPDVAAIGIMPPGPLWTLLMAMATIWGLVMWTTVATLLTHGGHPSVPKFVYHPTAPTPLDTHHFRAFPVAGDGWVEPEGRCVG